MNNEKITFMEYLASTEIIEHHSKALWIQIPKAMEKLSVHSWLICTKYNASFTPPFEIIETGKKHGSIIDGVLETGIVAKLIKNKKPSIFFHTNVRSFLFINAFLWKIKYYFKRNPNKRYRPFFIYMADWDGKRHFENFFSFYLRMLLYVIYSYSYDLFIVPTSCTYNALTKIPFFRIKRAIFLHYGYPQDLFKIKRYEETIREKIILCVARITPIKGQDLLIEAFKELSEDFKDWTLIFVGKIEDDQYYKKLINLSENLLDKQVFFYLNINDFDLEKLYEKASIFCLPSYIESFGMVRIEAIGKGLPVITSDAGCGEDFSKMGVIIFKRGDKEDLKRKLRLMMSDENLRKNIVYEEQKHIYSYEEYAKKILAEYKKFINF